MAASLSFSLPGQLSYMDDSSLTHILSYDQLPRSCTFYLICVHLLGVFASSLRGKAAGSGLQRGDVLPEKVEMLLTSRCPASRSSSGAVLQEQELRGGRTGAERGRTGAEPPPRCGQGQEGTQRVPASCPGQRRSHRGALAAGPQRGAGSGAVPGCLRGPQRSAMSWGAAGVRIPNPRANPVWCRGPGRCLSHTRGPGRVGFGCRQPPPTAVRSGCAGPAPAMLGRGTGPSRGPGGTYLPPRRRGSAAAPP